MGAKKNSTSCESQDASFPDNPTSLVIYKNNQLAVNCNGCSRFFLKALITPWINSDFAVGLKELQQGQAVITHCEICGPAWRLIFGKQE